MIRCLIAVLVVCAVVIAQPQQSENFRITKSVLDAGGGASSSANFNLVSAFGQPTPIGVQTSENFTLYAGFLSPTFAIAALNDVDSLVIQRLAGPSANMRLAWKPVAGAVSYNVYRSTNALFVHGPATLIGSSATTQYDDLGAVNLAPVQHFYLVTAVDAGGALLTRAKGLPKGSDGSELSVQPSAPSPAEVKVSAEETKPEAKPTK